MPAETDAFEANRAWEIDRALMLEKSERRAWRVGGFSVVVAVLAVLAVFVQGPLRQLVGIPIVVDRTTGETTVQQRLSVESVPMMEALDKHNLAVFVRAREGYSWWFLQRDFDQVARMAVPVVFTDYNRHFEGDGALQKKLAGAEQWRINVVGVRLSASARRGNAGVASVTYDKVVHLVDRNLPDVTTPPRREHRLRVPAEGALQGEGPDRESLRVRRHRVPIRPRDQLWPARGGSRQAVRLWCEELPSPSPPHGLPPCKVAWLSRSLPIPA